MLKRKSIDVNGNLKKTSESYKAKKDKPKLVTKVKMYSLEIP